MAKILITGSTGYIGSRLIQVLGKSKHTLVCTARNPEYLEKSLPKNAEAMQVDFNHDMNFKLLFQGCDVAFFLMHSLGEKKEFESIELNVAVNFSLAAKSAGIKKIIYLGGLLDQTEKEYSPHMRSRKKVGEILKQTGIPVIEFRASVILGAGSTSFELIRALVERLPVMVTPKWVRIKAQPIFINDVISYLTQSIDIVFNKSTVIEIGGEDVVTYQDIMKLYAQIRGLKRFMVPVPFLTPHLSSLWLGLVTPVYARVGRKLIDSMTSSSIITNSKPSQLFGIKPAGCYQSIKRCLESEDMDLMNTKWSDALSSSLQYNDAINIRYGNRLVDTHRIKVPFDVIEPFRPVESIGGESGWYFLTSLWKIRGYIDLLMGGIGLRRGRKHPFKISVGDPVDWWRVDVYNPGTLLSLRAEMRLPGRAWLIFELIKVSGDRYIQQTIIFDPLGLFGIVYWYALLPIHWILFKGMLKNIIKKGA